MNLTYVMGPIVAVDTLLNVNVQFHRVLDRQEKVRGWGWNVDDDTPADLCEIDPEVAIDDLLGTLRDRLTEQMEAWQEANAAAEERRLIAGS